MTRFDPATARTCFVLGRGSIARSRAEKLTFLNVTRVYLGSPAAGVVEYKRQSVWLVLMKLVGMSVRWLVYHLCKSLKSVASSEPADISPRRIAFRTARIRCGEYNCIKLATEFSWLGRAGDFSAVLPCSAESCEGILVSIIKSPSLSFDS